MPRYSSRRPPIITLLSDFGSRDFYVAAMKAAILRQCPAAQLVDVTHKIGRHDVVSGAITLERAIASFAKRTVHLAVVDPGVGTTRRILLTTIAGQTVVCPDNGLITWAVRRQGAAKFYELTWKPRQAISTTFHGRDIMGPVTGMLASGIGLGKLAKPIQNPVLLDMHLASTDRGVIIHIDAFGNATTNVPAQMVNDARVSIRIGKRLIGPVRQTYADVKPGHPLALIGSSDLLEIAVREGSAAEKLGLKVGDPIRIDRRPL